MATFRGDVTSAYPPRSISDLRHTEYICLYFRNRTSSECLVNEQLFSGNNAPRDLFLYYLLVYSTGTTLVQYDVGGRNSENYRQMKLMTS